MHYNCLIVDDEEELSKMTAEYFQMFDITTAYVNSAEECYKFFEDNTVDLLLLDINLGNGSGFDVCKKIREEYQLPILFISARQGDDDVLIALSIGGDDYIRKPYSMAILLAKVKVNLKRVEQLKTAGQDSVKVTDNDDINESIERLYKYKNTIVTKDKLFEEVWGDSFFSDGTLNVHIRKLREKLEENPNDPQIIKTVWGTGYILEL